MNPQKKDEDSMAGVVMALGFVLLIAFIVGAVISLVLTVVCLGAWKQEQKFFGHTITPVEARCFIGFGLFGGLVGFLFGIIMLLNHMGPETDIFMWPIIGYVLGSLGWGIAYATNQKHAAPPIEPVQPPPLQSVHQRPATQRAEFEFASWNDEEPHH